jgi:hypothetical protein
MKLELPQLVEIYIALLTRLKTSTAQEAQQEGRIIYHWILGNCHEKAQKAQRRNSSNGFSCAFCAFSWQMTNGKKSAYPPSPSLSCNRRVIARARSYDYILPRGSDFDFSVALIADLV